MSANIHTPGPWAHGQQGCESGWIEITAADDRNPVACATPAKPGTAEERRDAETRANARLIAAAPELLEALQELLASVEGVPCGPEAKCRAAIAKATGESA